jgi:hypothetical protein
VNWNGLFHSNVDAPYFRANTRANS